MKSSNISLFTGLLLLISGCHSSRSSVEDTHARVESKDIEVVSHVSDTLLDISTEVTQARDTSICRVEGSGSIVIDRDSSGKPVKILWTRKESAGSVTSSRGEKDRWFYGLNATRDSEVTKSLESVEDDSKHQERKVSYESLWEMAKPQLWLMALYAIGALLIVIIYYGVSIYNKWKGK